MLAFSVKPISKHWVKKRSIREEDFISIFFKIWRKKTEMFDHIQKRDLKLEQIDYTSLKQKNINLKFSQLCWILLIGKLDEVSSTKRPVYDSGKSGGVSDSQLTFYFVIRMICYRTNYN